MGEACELVLICLDVCRNRGDRSTYDFKGVGNDADSHELLAIVAAVHHQGVCKAFDDWALGFAEALDCIAAGGVGDVDWSADLNVIAKSWDVS